LPLFVFLQFGLDDVASFGVFDGSSSVCLTVYGFFDSALCTMQCLESKLVLFENSYTINIGDICVLLEQNY
jgi:hypothetical protein